MEIKNIQFNNYISLVQTHLFKIPVHLHSDNDNDEIFIIIMY